MRTRTPAHRAAAVSVGSAGRPARSVLAAVALTGILLTSAAGVVLALAGFRWFTVETPSMGTVAPVGTLVVTAPTAFADVRIGDVIAFRPPTEPTRVYTHRVVAVGEDGLQTRGDINGAADAWRVGRDDLVGRSVFTLPGGGFLLRAVPMLLAGNAVVRLATARVRSTAQRSALRTIGFSLVASLPSFFLHPFVQLVILATQVDGGAIKASVVSTGLLPIHAVASASNAVALRDGQVATMTLPTVPGGYRLTADLALSPPEWALMIAVCCIPLVWTMVVGLPDSPEDAEADDADARGRSRRIPLRAARPAPR